jgi:hypothetical protein
VRHVSSLVYARPVTDGKLLQCSFHSNILNNSYVTPHICMLNNPTVSTTNRPQLASKDAIPVFSKFPILTFTQFAHRSMHGASKLNWRCNGDGKTEFWGAATWHHIHSTFSRQNNSGYYMYHQNYNSNSIRSAHTVYWCDLYRLHAIHRMFPFAPVILCC